MVFEKNLSRDKIEYHNNCCCNKFAEPCGYAQDIYAKPQDKLIHAQPDNAQDKEYDELLRTSLVWPPLEHIAHARGVVEYHRDDKRNCRGNEVVDAEYVRE